MKEFSLFVVCFLFFPPIAGAEIVVFKNGRTMSVKAYRVDGDITAQTRQAFANLEAVLNAAGLGFADVVKVNVYLTSMADFEGMNAVYGQVFTAPFPARTTVAVAGLPLEARVEIELVAATRQG